MSSDVSRSRYSWESDGESHEREALASSDQDSPVPDREAHTDDVAAGQQEREIWQPQELRQRSVLAFLTCMVTIMLVLAALYIVSERRQGLCRVDDNFYYLWTYAPTAVFTLLMTYWALAEYRIRQLMPWILMRQGPTSAADSVLLDYTSVWNGTALYHSLRRRHVFVSLGIVVTLLLQLITVLSTGLLAAQEVTIRGIVPVTLHQRFDQKFDGLTLSRFQIEHGPQPVGTGKPEDGLAYSAAYGEHVLNLSYPLGVDGHFAYPKFDSATLNTNRTSLTIRADVLGFETICDEAKPIPLINTPAQGSIPGWLLSTETCNVTAWPAYWMDNFTSVGSVTKLQHAYCNLNETRFPYGASGRARAALVYTTSRLSLSPPGERMWFIDDSGQNTTRYSQIAGVICRARYNISRGSVSYSGSTQTGNLVTNVNVTDSRVRWLPQVSGSDLLTAAWLSLQTMSAGLDKPNLPPHSAAFEDLPIVSGYLEKVFSATGAQIAQRWLLEPATDVTIGDFASSEDRLFVHLLTFALIEGMCALVLVSIVWIYMRYIPCAASSTDPGSIGQIASILGRDSILCNMLDGMGSSDLVTVAAAAKDSTFSTQPLAREPQGRFRISDGSPFGAAVSIAGPRGRIGASGKVATKPIAWWRPFSSSVWAHCLTAGTCLGLLIALEVVYRISSRNNPVGITNVTPHDRYLRYTWTYVPAALMTSVHLLITSLYTTGELLQPYRALRQGGSSARHSLLARYSGPLPLRSLWRAVILKQSTIIALAIAAVLGPLLTIVVSGLFNPRSASGSASSIRITQNKVWNLTDTWLDTLESGIPMAVPATLVLYSNLSYPAFTYQDLAFPSFNAPSSADPSLGSFILDEDPTIEATIPALRAVLNCTAVPSNQLRIVSHNGGRILHPPDLGLAHCPSLGNVDFTNPYLVPISVNGTHFIGAGGVDLYAPEGCPSFTDITGFMNHATSPVVKANMIYCTPYLEEIDVRTTFKSSDFSIDVRRPPVPLNDSAKVVLTGFYGPDSKASPNVFYPTSLAYALSDFNTQDNRTVGLGVFLKAAVYGVNGVPLSVMVSYNDTAAQIARYETVFGIMMAQLLNTFGRSITPSAATMPDHLPSFDAVLIGPSSLRLIQSMISTRILQGLLGIMAICVLLAQFTCRSHEILPKNPSSIAAVASLLAGSELLSSLPPGSEWGNESHHLKLFDGWLFSMGWWNNGSKKRFGIDIGQHADNAKADQLVELVEKQGNAQVMVRERCSDDDSHSQAHREDT